MAGQGSNETETWRTTIIMSNMLKDHEVTTSLQSQQHKVRFSESIQSGLIIFPLSGIAFFLANAQDLINTPKDIVHDRIQQFISVHRNSFLIIVAALHGPEEWDLMFSIQMRFLGSNLRIIPAHNGGEAVKSMLTVAKATCKPHAENIWERLLKAKIHMVQNSLVWKTLDKM
ncbi:protein SPO16 homolog [Gastrophryne carolinensis]